MVKRIQSRGYFKRTMQELVKFYPKRGLAFIEHRHFDLAHTYVCLDGAGDIWEIDLTGAVHGPCLNRKLVRASSDYETMMWVMPEFVRLVANTSLRPLPPNPTKVFTAPNRIFEETLVREYARLTRGVYMPPALTGKMIHGIAQKDDGGVEY